jgi:hypothetical protein
MRNAVDVLQLAMQVYEERSITARPHNSFEDQQMCDLLVQMLGNQDFFPDLFIETIDTLGILDNEYEGTEQTDQPPDSEEDVPVSRPSSEQSSRSSYHPSPKKRSNENVKMEDREQAIRYWLNKDGKKRYGLATVQKRFRFVTSERQLYRWKRQIERQEAPLPMTKKTAYDRLYAEFIEARQNKPSLRTRGM